MIFVINNLKYDTDKMELIWLIFTDSEKITSWMNGERFVSGSRAFRIVS